METSVAGLWLCLHLVLFPSYKENSFFLASFWSIFSELHKFIIKDISYQQLNWKLLPWILYRKVKQYSKLFCRVSKKKNHNQIGWNQNEWDSSLSSAWPLSFRRIYIVFLPAYFIFAPWNLAVRVSLHEPGGDVPDPAHECKWVWLVEVGRTKGGALSERARKREVTVLDRLV